MRFTAEVAQRLQRPRSCQGLLYAPLRGQLSYQKTRRYVFDFEGSEETMRAFVQKVLLDEVSQDLYINDSPIYDGYCFYLDFGMKSTALDLEKEMILSYHRASSDGEFKIESLSIYNRLYIFGEHAEEASPEPFVKDLVNPAIHVWSVTDVRSCA